MKHPSNIHQYFWLGLFALLVTQLHSRPLPDLPGNDVTRDSGFIAIKPHHADSSAPQKEKERPNGWLNATVQDQLGRDPTLITLGYGAVFVPSYTEGRREPEVFVYSGDEMIKTGSTGERILLAKGQYSLYFGSGNLKKKRKRDIEIEEGHTLVAEPTWSGLIVETVNGDGSHEAASYELIHMENWQSFGKGYGLNEERIEDIETWIVPPGMYRISKVGENFASPINYITVQLNKGELTTVELVVDPTTNDVIAGGVKGLRERQTIFKYWSYGVRLGASMNFNRQVDVNDQNTESWKLINDLRIRAKYDNTKYLGISELIAQNSLNKTKGQPFIPSNDAIEMRSTWIRRLNKWVGPYVRGKLNTHFFPQKVDQDTLVYSKNNMLFLSTDGNFVSQPSFIPMTFGEGMGVNLDVLSKYYLEVSLQSGLAARQEIKKGSYSQSSLDSVYNPQKNDFTIGVENNLIVRAILGSYLSLDLTADFYAPNGLPKNNLLDDLTLDARLYLTRHLELAYVLNIKEKNDDVINRFPRSQNLYLRATLNF